MFLEFHDAEVGNSLCCAAYRIDYEYQAEQWVIDQGNDPFHDIVRAVLFSEGGDPFVEWARATTDGDFAKVLVTPGTKADPRTMQRAAEKRSEDGLAS